MRALLICLLAAALAAPAWSQDRPRRRRPPVELSDVLTHSPLAPCDVRQASARRTPLRVATWNIRAARSAPVADIAAELHAMGADVIAIQEIDVLARRTGFVDQPAALAEALGFHYAFAASIKWDGGDYGLALLSRHPLTAVRRHRIEAPNQGEPRIVLDATICAAGKPLRLFNHHADVRGESRQAGLTQLAALVAGEVGRGIVVLGDFNDVPDAPGVLSLLNAGLIDPFAARDADVPSEWRIDYLLVDPPLAPLISSAQVWSTDRSDHHAVLLDLDW